MKREKSCGVVVYTRVNHDIKFLLVQSLTGVYGFPKGHVEGNEIEIETALREVYEETHLRVTLDHHFKTTVSYLLPIAEKTMKEVVYFLGYYENQNPIYQESELISASLFSYEEAIKLFQFDSSKRVLIEAYNHLLSLSSKVSRLGD